MQHWKILFYSLCIFLNAKINDPAIDFDDLEAGELLSSGTEQVISLKETVEIHGNYKNGYVSKLKVTVSNMKDLVNYVHKSFGAYNARLIYFAIKSHLGDNWYDPNAILNINFIRTQNSKLIKKVQFLGSGKCIDIVLSDFNKKNTAKNGKSNLLKVTLQCKMLNKSQLPYCLMANVKNILKKIKKNHHLFSYIDVYYRAGTFDVQCIVLYHNAKTRCYFIKIGKNIVNRSGNSVVPKRITLNYGLQGQKVITSGFGYRYHPVLKTNKFHSGIDLRAPQGTKIYAAYDGTILYAGWLGGYGQCIKIYHGNNIVTYYGHLSRIRPNIKVGAKVRRNDYIGNSGSTGVSTAAHLHFEVREKGKPVNPCTFIFKVFKEISLVGLSIVLEEIDELDKRTVKIN